MAMSEWSLIVCWYFGLMLSLRPLIDDLPQTKEQAKKLIQATTTTEEIENYSNLGENPQDNALWQNEFIFYFKYPNFLVFFSAPMVSNLLKLNIKHQRSIPNKKYEAFAVIWVLQNTQDFQLWFRKGRQK